jgi:hypothetical protein
MLASCNWGMAIFSSNEKRIRDAFNTVHKEFEEHLETINANTEEILENRYMINELSGRIAKVADDISEIKDILATESLSEPAYEHIELTLREQEVFLVLYMNESGVSYSQLTKYTSLPISVVQDLVFDLISKGIPVLKQRKESDIILSLDIEFRERQTQHNIVGIDEQVGKLMSKDLQLTLVE